VTIGPKNVERGKSPLIVTGKQHDPDKLTVLVGSFSFGNKEVRHVAEPNRRATTVTNVNDLNRADRVPVSLRCKASEDCRLPWAERSRIYRRP
jgi:hypothetical protein